MRWQELTNDRLRLLWDMGMKWLVIETHPTKPWDVIACFVSVTDAESLAQENERIHSEALDSACFLVMELLNPDAPEEEKAG